MMNISNLASISLAKLKKITEASKKPPINKNNLLSKTARPNPKQAVTKNLKGIEKRDISSKDLTRLLDKSKDSKSTRNLPLHNKSLSRDVSEGKMLNSKTEDRPLSKSPTTSRNPSKPKENMFLGGILKQFYDFKNKKKTNFLYNSALKKLPSNRSKDKIKPQSNLNDISTNSTDKSKKDLKKIEYPENPKNIVENNVHMPSFAPDTDEEIYNEKLQKNMNMPRDNRFISNSKEVDFRLMNTSPLIRKKPENELKDKKLIETIKTKTIEGPVSVTKSIRFYKEYTKTGYQGPGVTKYNQDSFFITPQFNDNPNSIYFGVCDGHGIVGHDVSGFIKVNLPKNLNKSLKMKKTKISNKDCFPAIEEAFLQTNYSLITNSKIDSTFSGSTCVSLVFTPEKILTANIGDSRAVMEWIAQDLTRDHKPNSDGEMERILKQGGRVEPFRDEEEGFIGPHRVWLPEDDIPGLAMSRSFGDRLAASVGVICIPEIFTFPLSEEDKFFIIASDGVWEFIESQECVEIIKDYYLKNDINGCCEFIYRESSKRWLEEEGVIDDITMLIVFLN